MKNNKLYPRLLLLLIPFCISFGDEPAEDETVQAELYFLLLRYETSTPIQSPDGVIQTLENRSIAWLSSNQIQTEQLDSGRISRGHDYQGSPQLLIGKENPALEAESPLIPEAGCQLKGGKTLVTLLPSSDNQLRIQKAIPIPLPETPISRRQVLVVNLSGHDLAARIQGSEQPIHVPPLVPQSIPEALLSDIITLRLDFAANQENGWNRIPGIRTMLSDGTHLVIVHPSKYENQWTVRTQRLSTR